MARKRKVKIDRLIIVILSLLLVIGALGFGIYELFSLISKNNKQKQDSKPVIVETSDNVKLTLSDYTVFEDDSNLLDFNFIIAKIKFESDKPFSFDLADLQTSEKIYLNDTSKYTQLLNEKKYDLSSFDLANYINSEQNVIERNIFIPYKTDNDNLSIYDVKDPTISINIDLTSKNKKKYVTSLKFDTESNIVVNNTAIRVSSSYVSTTMKHNGEEYDIPSSIKVFTFIIYADNVDENVSIVDAYFIKDNDSEKIPCLSNEFRSSQVDNIIGKKLIKGENGALFFEAYSREDRADYEGSLMIKFSNSNDWVKVSTVLE